MASATLELGAFGDGQLDGEALLSRLVLLKEVTGRRMGRWMGYYRNPTTDLMTLLPYARNGSLSMRLYRQYQEVGLPTRITGFRHTVNGEPVLAGVLEVQRKEVVVENDIAWRVDTMVDFAVGQMPVVTSGSADAGVRGKVTAILQAVLEANGGLEFLRQLTLLGAVHGSAYVVVHPSEELLARIARAGGSTAAPTDHQPLPESDVTGLPEVLPESARGAGSAETEAEAPRLEGREDLLALARTLRLQIVEAPRVLPILEPGSSLSAPEMRYCVILNDTQVEGKAGKGAGRESTFQRVTRWLTGGMPVWPEGESKLTFDVWSSGHWKRYVGGALVDEGSNPIGFVPVVAFINQYAPPFFASSPQVLEGMSEVEPLIGMQDELNTRLLGCCWRCQPCRPAAPWLCRFGYLRYIYQVWLSCSSAPMEVSYACRCPSACRTASGPSHRLQS